jgi:hypothetical protein
MERLQPRKHIFIHRPAALSGLMPIQGNPGAFVDQATGRTITIGEWKDDAKFSSITIPSRPNYYSERRA